MGAPSDDDLGIASGSAYVLDAATGNAVLELNQIGGAAGWDFGQSVALDGTAAVIGAPDDGTVVGRAGALVRVDLQTGTQLPALYASDAIAGLGLGWSVAIDGDLVLGGAPHSGTGAAPGKAYLYSFSTGEELHILQPLDPSNNDGFGTSVALANGRALVSRVSGAVYAFDVESGAELYKLTNPGENIAADGDTLIAGKPQAQVGGIQTGKVRVYDLVTGTQTKMLTADDGAAGDGFGQAVALHGDLAVIGAPLDDDQGNASGSAYVFRISTGEQVAKLLPSNGTAQSGFGESVAIGPGGIYVGAPLENVVYVFETPIGSTPLVYCEAKTSSADCAAQIGTSNANAHPVSGAGDYSVTAIDVQSFKAGLVLAGVSGPAEIPFAGGTLCISGSSKRGPLQFSGGVTPGTCEGSYDVIVNDGQVIPSGLDGGPGRSVWYQWIYRDPQNGPGSLGLSLSDAVQLDFLQAHSATSSLRPERVRARAQAGMSHDVPACATNETRWTPSLPERRRAISAGRRAHHSSRCATRRDSSRTGTGFYVGWSMGRPGQAQSRLASSSISSCASASISASTSAQKSAARCASTSPLGPSARSAFS